MRQPAVVLGVVVFACLSFIPGLRGPFIHDDYSNLSLVLETPESLLHALDLIFSNGSGFLRRPISNATFLLNFLAFGDGALWFKLVNLGLHAAGGAALYFLSVQLFRGLNPESTDARIRGLALFTTAVWVAHPLNVSTVLYVVQRMTILATIFSLLALILLAKRLSSGSKSTFSAPFLVGYYALWAAALLSKETAAALPLIAMAVWIAMSPTGLRANITHRLPDFVATVGVPVAIGTAVFVWRFQSLMAGYASRDFTVWERAATECVLLWVYVKDILLPLPSWLAFFRDDVAILSPGSPGAIAALAFWVAAVGLAVHSMKRGLPVVAFALLWFLGGHALESSIFPLELAYEHRNYLPMMGVVMLGVTGLDTISRGNTQRLRLVALLLLGVLMSLTASRAATWSSLPRLAEFEANRSPDSLRAQFLRAHVALANGEWSRAATSFERIRQIDPDSDWMVVAELSAACQGYPWAVNGAEIERRLLASADDTRTARGLPQLASVWATGNCAALTELDFRLLVRQMAEVVRKQGNDARAAEYLYTEAEMAWNEADEAGALASLHRSIELSPTTSEPLEQLAKVQLALGDFDGARQSVQSASEIWRKREPWRIYRLREWQNAIEQIQNSTAPPAAP